jgi:Rrf2 family protein
MAARPSRREGRPSGDATRPGAGLEGAGQAVEAAEEGAAEARAGPEAEHGKTAGENFGRASGLVEHSGGVSEGEGVEEDRDPERDRGHAAGGEKSGEEGEENAHGKDVGRRARLPPVLDGSCLFIRRQCVSAAGLGGQEATLMLTIPKMTDYAVVLLGRLGQEPERRASAHVLAETSGLPGPTVAKIMNRLAGEQVVKSIRGARGGYELLSAPSEIPVIRVVEAMNGPVCLTADDGDSPARRRQDRRKAGGHWTPIGNALRAAMARTTVAQIAADRRR